MARQITFSKEQAKEMADELISELMKGRFIDGDIKFQKSPPKSNEKATIIFTDIAWMKHRALLDMCSKEVAWHGVAERVEGEENTYRISDILVYPQTVTAAFVDMDTEKYAKWIQDNMGDERFDHLYMQAHSHVDMGVNPSGTDLQHQSGILDMLGKDSFYIFMIYNKRLNRYIRIFDMRKNLVFENEDVSVTISGLTGFAAEVTSNVQERSYQYNYGGFRDGDWRGLSTPTPANGGVKTAPFDSAKPTEKPAEKPRTKLREEPKEATKPDSPKEYDPGNASKHFETNEEEYLRGY